MGLWCLAVGAACAEPGLPLELVDTGFVDAKPADGGVSDAGEWMDGGGTSDEPFECVFFEPSEGLEPFAGDGVEAPAELKVDWNLVVRDGRVSAGSVPSRPAGGWSWHSPVVERGCLSSQLSTVIYGPNSEVSRRFSSSMAIYCNTCSEPLRAEWLSLRPKAYRGQGTEFPMGLETPDGERAMWCHLPLDGSYFADVSDGVVWCLDGRESSPWETHPTRMEWMLPGKSEVGLMLFDHTQYARLGDSIFRDWRSTAQEILAECGDPLWENVGTHPGVPYADVEYRIFSAMVPFRRELGEIPLFNPLDELCRAEGYPFNPFCMTSVGVDPWPHMDVIESPPLRLPFEVLEALREPRSDERCYYRGD